MESHFNNGVSMEEQRGFTSHDIKIAQQLGALTSTIESLNRKIDDLMREKSDDSRAVWAKLDFHGKLLSDYNAAIRWIIGIGVGFQVAWGIVLAMMKGH